MFVNNTRTSSKVIVCLVTFYCAHNVCVMAFPSGGCTKEKEHTVGGGEEGRLATKRDVFMSRGWGAGGMPYNTMYLNSKGPRTRKQEMPRVEEESLLVRSLPELVEEDIQKYPIASPSVQYLTAHAGPISHGDIDPPRKQFSIIPQLFVSYGWGPLGK